MMRWKLVLALTLPGLIVGTGLANSAGMSGHSHGSKYAGQENRLIKSLSADDIKELRRGGGWGLAKAAELNGVPGPAHLLEMKEAIPLDAAQIRDITALFNTMRARAIEQGEKLIGQERALETHFRMGTITDNILRTSLAAIAETKRQLRYVHLATHLKTPSILSAAQIRKYNELRGYNRADPCAAAPVGHDVAQWRKHNGCP